MSSMFRKLRPSSNDQGDASRRSDSSNGLVDHQSQAKDNSLLPSQPLTLPYQQITSEKDTSQGSLGLHLIHGTSDRSADIIFVHGLGGSSQGTWMHDRDPNTFWPAWICHEEGLSHFRVFSYGYNAKYKDSDNPLSILDFSKGLLIRMKTYGHGELDEIGSRPIIFVAHSMGGLVVKKALIIGKNDDHYSHMLSSVHAVMFLSTPHRGSAHARSLNIFLALMVGTSAKTYVSELETSSTSIEDISEQFRAVCSSWRLISLYETQPTKLVFGLKKMIVDKESGVLNYPAEISVPVDADHNTICKFDSRLNSNYVLIKNLLRDLTKDFANPIKVRDVKARHLYTEDWVETLRSIFGIQEDMRETLETNLPQAVEGTCRWLFEHENFRSWLDATEGTHRTLWLTSLPGTGKSVLAAKTVEHIQQTLSCQYHFFTEAQQEKRSIAYCLRFIGFQMAITYPVLSDKLLRLYPHGNLSVATQKFRGIWETVFEDIIFKMDFGSTLHWVIDGLDEADAPALLIRSLIQMKSKSCVKLLFLSRPKRELTGLAASRSGSVILQPISTQDTMTDIQAYIRSEVAEILPQDQDLQSYVVDRIATRAEGSFLWSRMTLKSLWNNWHTKADIETMLSEVPNDMHELYAQMINNIKSQPSRPQHIAFRVLTWAACSFRPLTISELVAALKPQFEGFLDLSETVVQTCGQFIRVDNESISLIHDTARKFLLEISADSPSAFGFTISHDQLALVCLQYLSQDHWKQVLGQLSENKNAYSSDRLEPIYHKFPFLKYSINYWAYHVSLSGVGKPELLVALRLFCNRYILHWVQAIALASNLRDIPRAAQYLRKWLRRWSKVDLSYDTLGSMSDVTVAEETAFLGEWTRDLIRVVAKFGSTLSSSPSSIQRYIPCFCPQSSIIYKTYQRQESPLISVTGLSHDVWDDNLARLSVGQDETASAIRCAGTYFLTLVSGSGTVIIWDIETCEEVRKICHKERVTIMETNKKGSLVATDGRLTTRVWDISTGQQLYSISKIQEADIISMSFAQADTKLLLCYNCCAVLCHDLSSSVDTVVYQEGGKGLRSCPRLMVLSPDQTKLAIGYRGRPVRVWDLAISPQPAPRVVTRSAERNLLEDGEEVFNSPEIVRWHPDGSALYVLYQDAVILVWQVLDDVGQEFRDTGAREMVLNEDGTYILTSCNRGSISVWSLPRFNLVYRLRSEGFVRDLAISPDGQRIFDVRYSGCNVWAPDALVRPDELDRDEKSTTVDASIMTEAVSEPVYAEDNNMRGRITALMCDNEDEFYCCGKDDGSVSIHEMRAGTRVRKVTSHSSSTNIIALGWSKSRRFLASADNSAVVKVKRLKIKEDGKWAVFPVFDLRLNDPVTQLLFSLDERFVLVSTFRADQVWDIKTKNEVCKCEYTTSEARKWINHPHEESQLIWLEPNNLYTHEWATLEHLDTATLQPSVLPDPANLEAPSTTPSTFSDKEETLEIVVQPNSHRYLLHKVAAGRNLPNWPSGDRIRLDLVPISDLKLGCNTMERKSLVDLTLEVQHILGSARDRLVFLNRSNWICTSVISWEMGPMKSHFFLPRDWVSQAARPLHLLVNHHGTILTERNGEVAIIRYSGRL